MILIWTDPVDETMPRESIKNKVVGEFSIKGKAVEKEMGQSLHGIMHKQRRPDSVLLNREDLRELLMSRDSVQVHSYMVMLSARLV